MSIGFLDPAAMVQRLLIQFGLDPDNLTYDAIFERLLDVALASITFANVFAVIGGIFLVSSFVVRTIVPMRVLCIVSIVFFLGAAVLAGSVQHFLMYFLALPVNVVRLVQIQNLIKKARSSAQGTLSLGWLRPFMTPRDYQKGDVLFRKGDVATEMFLTAAGKFLVTEINIEIPPDRVLGELGFLSPNNHRTQSVECIEDGQVLTIAYDKLHEIYLQNPEFGYYFLRLTSDRLLQNHARLEGLVAETKAALAAAETSQAGGASTNQDNAAKAIPLTIKAIRAAGVAANRRLKISAAARGTAAVNNVIGRRPKSVSGPAGAESTAAERADAEAAQRRIRALAIVERHANYSGASGFIPLPIANAAAVAIAVVHMVRALNELYGVPPEDNRVYGIAIGLAGGLVPSRFGPLAASAIAPFVPGYNLFGLAVSSVTASAYARKVGRMLIDDFERRAALERKRAASRVRRWPDIWPLRWARSDRTWSRSALERGIRRG
jgi:CRP-like cAMP-binding protein